MHNPARAYLENKVLTASPEQLQLMLYDGAIRFAQVARRSLEEKDFEMAQGAFERVDAIIGELISGLRPEVNAELCSQFAALYTFCARRINEAHFRHDVQPLDEAIEILKHIRETWTLLIEKLAAEQAENSEGDFTQPDVGQETSIAAHV